MKYDIIFIGNTSIDYFGNFQQPGGGAFYSATSASIADKKMKIAFYSKINKNTHLRQFEKLFIGEKVDADNTSFDYSCTQNECKIRNLLSFSVKNINIETEHIHISVRKGVDDICLDNICYKTISVDVTKTSINDSRDKIIKFGRIDFLFCNLEEYSSISSLNNVKTFVVTNADKSVVVFENDVSRFFPIPLLKRYNKVVGAGDSFIGGFLSEWIKNRDLREAVLTGTTCAHLSMTNRNQFEVSRIDYIIRRNQYRNKIREIPNKLIVIGSAGVGKTKFVRTFVEFNPAYKLIDDYNLLMDIVEGDSEQKYTRKLPVGFEIINYRLWNDVIDAQYIEASKYKNVVYELSRGTDWSYIKNEGITIDEIYDYAIEKFAHKEDVLIINLYAPYMVRKKRNTDRALYGEHCVDDKTMAEVYKKTYVFSQKNIKRIKHKCKNVLQIVNISNRKWKDDITLYHYVMEKALKKWRNNE